MKYTFTHNASLVPLRTLFVPYSLFRFLFLLSFFLVKEEKRMTRRRRKKQKLISMRTNTHERAYQVRYSSIRNAGKNSREEREKVEPRTGKS